MSTTPNLRSPARRRPLAAAAVAAATAALAAAAPAARAVPAARAAAAAGPSVLAVTGDDVYVDLGSADGVGAGARLSLLRVVIATDPTTGRALRDRFAVGTLTVERAGDHLALAHPEAALAGKVAVGDGVALASPARRYVDPWQERLATAAPAASAPAAGAGQDEARAAASRAVEEAGAARAVWQANLGQPPAARAARWRAYLSGRPDSPYAAAVTAEIASLDRQAAALTAARTRAEAPDDAGRARELAAALADLTPAAKTRGPLAVDAPAQILPGRAVTLAFAVVDPAAATRAWLYVRRHGAPAYRRTELVRAGDAYLRATIPADQIGPDGADWFVEAAGGDGPPRAAIGDEAHPRHLAAARDLTEPPIARHRSTVTATVDYVDFDGRLQRGHDQYYQAEVGFTYRFLHPVHAVRLGFGTLSGQGGPKDVIDADPTGRCLDASGVYQCKQVDFSYVYTEVEWRPSRLIGIMIRPQAGLLTTDRRVDPGAPSRCRTADVADCDFGTGFGLRGRIRFGDEDGTNLLVGVGFTQGVGTIIEANYQWAPHPVVPITLAVQVTDQPVPEDFGVRIIGDVGWRGLGWVYPSVRISYQARDIDHAGLSGGVGLNFDW